LVGHWDAAENGDYPSIVAVLKELLDDLAIQQGAGPVRD